MSATAKSQHTETAPLLRTKDQQCASCLQRRTGFEEREEGQALQAELYERIGRINMEVEWLKKSVACCG